MLLSIDPANRSPKVASAALLKLTEHQQHKNQATFRHKALRLLATKEFDSVTGELRTPDLVSAWVQVWAHSSDGQSFSYIQNVTDRTLGAFAKLSGLRFAQITLTFLNLLSFQGEST